MNYDLDYIPGTLARPLDRAYVSTFEEYLEKKFDCDYLNHQAAFHGGQPRRNTFRTATGVKKIDRFLCFVPDFDEDPVNAYYAVGAVWSPIADRMGDYLIPFAILEYGDLVCFDYQNAKVPTVAIWKQLGSEVNSPNFETIAENYRAFLDLLEMPQ